MLIIKNISVIFITVVCVGLISCTPKQAHVGRDVPSEGGQTTALPSNESRSSRDRSGMVIEDMGFVGDGATVEFEQMDGNIFIKREIGKEAEPVVGGKARVYLYRGFLDDAVADMVRLNPFGSDGQNRTIFTITDSTHRRLELKLTNKITRGNGRKATALDFVELWTRFIKSRPAQGLALFRNVQGAENYVNGKDPLINGFSAADENTIKIRFEKADPLAFQRMNTSKLIGGPFMLGAYYAGGASGSEMRLLPNANSLSDRAFLSECTVQMGGDPDPMMSFSAGSYSAMTLYKLSDLEIVKKELADKALLYRLPADRYFLACKHEDPQIRKFMRGIIDGANMLNNYVMADGEEIASVTAQNAAIEIPKNRVPIPTTSSKPLKIVYRDDDPISKIIAETLLADFSGVGLLSEIIATNAETYETALVRGTYDCAIGWVHESVIDNPTEQLHFASMWFSDNTDAQARLRDYKEIPLFSVNNFLLLRDDTRLYQNKISGIWVESDSR